MIRRRMDRILAQGEGKQLAWLAGYRAAPKCERSDRSRFKELKNKDRLIVQNIPYIMNGEEIVRI